MDPLERRTRARRSSEVMRRADFAVKYYLEGSFKGAIINVWQSKVRQVPRGVLRKCAAARCGLFPKLPADTSETFL